MSDAPLPAQSRSRPGSCSLTLEYAAAAVVLGLATGAVSMLWWLYHIWQLNFFTWNVHMLWMPLVSEVLFMLALLGLASPVALLLPRRSFDFALGGVLGFFASFTVLAASGLLHLWAVLLMSLGMGLQLARLFQEHSGRVRRTACVAATVGLVFVALFAGTLIGWRAWQEQTALAGLEAAPPDAPNVLLVVWDTVRADQVETVQDGGAPTPSLNQLANRGVVFERAIAPASWTLPSHTSMFTGQFPHEFSADWFTPIDQRQTMLAEVLRDHGYQTGGFVANNGYCGRGFGMNQGFLHYEDFKVNWRQIGSCNFFYQVAMKKWPQLLPTKSGAEITDDFLCWHQRIEGERPFFAFLNYMDAHTPYLPETIDGRPLRPREVARMQAFEMMDPEEVSEADRELALRCYRAQITSLDAQLGRLLDTLRRREALDSTLVVVVSDHGEHFGEHGLYFHGNSLYKPLVHVPLVIAGSDDVPRGRRVATPVSLRNVAATILDCAGVGEDSPIRGITLLDVAADTQDGDDRLQAARDVVYAWNSLEGRKAYLDVHQPMPCFRKSVAWNGPLNLWVDGPYFLIQDSEGEAELYNIVRDPRETHDLCCEDGVTSLFSRMMADLERFLSRE